MPSASVQQIVAKLKGSLRLSHLASGPAFHCKRLTRLFSPKERRQLLELRDTERATSGRQQDYSVEQFVAFHLFFDSPEHWDQGEDSDEAIEKFALVSPAEIHLAQLEPWARKTVTEVCRGNSAELAAKLLARLLLTDGIEFAGDGIREALRNCLDRPVATPEVAAAVSQCLLHNERLCGLVADEARLVSDHALLVLPGPTASLGAQHEFGEEIEQFVDTSPRDAAESLHWFASEDLPSKATFYRRVREDLNF
jgi:hypothetical protein